MNPSPLLKAFEKLNAYLNLLAPGTRILVVVAFGFLVWIALMIAVMELTGYVNHG